jgi:DNA-binding transcriptional MerR regulator
VRDALQRGRVLEAIKLMRAASGLGLAEVKQALEDYQRGKLPSGSASASTSASPSAFPQALAGAPLPPGVLEALQRGNKIEAIRRLREQTGLGLKESKDAVDAYRLLHPEAGDLSPGQVRSSEGSLWWAVALALVCLLGYWLFRRLY